ncbi:MAG: YkgJ family cysteine cluster protein [Archaeoglobaceae archaeon]
MYPEDTALFATLVNKSYKINIPLVCQKCGECCVKLSHVLFNGEEIDVEGVERIKDYLGMKYYHFVEDLKEEYSNRLDECKITGTSIVINPCPFLSHEGCRVYPARPTSCRRFPVYGDQNIDCPALSRFKKVINYLKSDAEDQSDTGDAGVYPMCASWDSIDNYKVKPSAQLVVKFLSIAQEEEIKYFLELNEIDEEHCHAQ